MRNRYLRQLKGLEMTTAIEADTTYVIEEIRAHRRKIDATQEPYQPTVLIVDDDSAARLTLCGLLWSEGYRIAFATSADDARERLNDIQPDVILCDLIMQGINGDEFCSWLKSHATWRYVPVIAITGVNNTVATAALLEAGADDVIVKPVKARELQARVGAAARTRDQYLELARSAHRSLAVA